jgi:hypothetical protein
MGDATTQIRTHDDRPSPQAAIGPEALAITIFKAAVA